MTRRQEPTYPRTGYHDRGEGMSAQKYIGIVNENLEWGSKTLLAALWRDHSRILRHLDQHGSGKVCQPKPGVLWL